MPGKEKESLLCFCRFFVLSRNMQISWIISGINISIFWSNALSLSPPLFGLKYLQQVSIAPETSTSAICISCTPKHYMSRHKLQWKKCYIPSKLDRQNTICWKMQLTLWLLLMVTASDTHDATEDWACTLHSCTPSAGRGKIQACCIHVDRRPALI